MRTIQKTVTYSVSIKEIGRPVSFTRKGDIPEIAIRMSAYHQKTAVVYPCYDGQRGICWNKSGTPCTTPFSELTAIVSGDHYDVTVVTTSYDFKS